MSDSKIGNMAKYAIAVGALAVIVLMTLAVVNQFSIQLRTPTTGTLLEEALPAENATKTLTSYPYLTELTGCLRIDMSFNIAFLHYSPFFLYFGSFP